MSNQPEQNIKNHAHLPKPFIAEVLAMLLVLGISAYLIYVALSATDGEGGLPVALAAGFLLHALVTTGLVLHLRFTALKLQDRIVRQEMRFRLHNVLPEELKGRIGEFSTGQLIAMRFSCDQQMPELAQKVLDDSIQDKTAIKKMVKRWQADWMRI